MKKIIPILIVGIIFLSTFTVIAINTDNIKTHEKIVTISFSNPKIIYNGEYIKIALNEATSELTESGKPTLPTVTKVYNFPFTTKIQDVSVSFSDIQKMPSLYRNHLVQDQFCLILSIL